MREGVHVDGNITLPVPTWLPVMGVGEPTPVESDIRVLTPEGSVGTVECDWQDFRHRYVRVRLDGDGRLVVFVDEHHPNACKIAELVWL